MPDVLPDALKVVQDGKLKSYAAVASRAMQLTSSFEKK